MSALFTVLCMVVELVSAKHSREPAAPKAAVKPAPAK
jgi:hypothetical protein